MKLSQLYDFGIDRITSSDQLRIILNELSQRFDLIMIKEHFDESLILLKEELCWSCQDIAYKVANQSLKPKRIISTETKSKLRHLLQYEFELYHFFLQKLRRKMDSYGKTRMKVAINHLHEAQAELHEKCQTKCNHLRHCALLKQQVSLRGCPCRGQFDFCKNCLALNMPGGGLQLNHYAKCVQNARSQQ